MAHVLPLDILTPLNCNTLRNVDIYICIYNFTKNSIYLYEVTLAVNYHE